MSSIMIKIFVETNLISVKPWSFSSEHPLQKLKPAKRRFEFLVDVKRLAR